MGIDLKRFTRWGQRLEVREDDPKVSRLELRHMREGATRSPTIYTFRLPRPEDKPWEDIGREFELEAEQDASGLAPGVHSYCIFAFTKGHTSVARMPFRVASDEDADGFSLSEGPNEKGLTSQAMRHVEVLMRSTAVAQAESARTQQRIIQALYEREAKMAEQQLRVFEMQEKLISQHQQRELDHLTAKHKAELWSEGADMVRAWGPTIMSMAARKTGVALPPGRKDNDPRLTNAKELIKTLTPDQFDALQKVFTPAQLIQFYEFHQSLATEAEAEEAKAEERGKEIDDRFKSADPNGAS